MTIQIFEFNEITELVRGNEQQFLERLQPLVRRQNVTLDLAHIARIDAAGLAALITLYCDACKAGYRFTIANPSPHVLEILAIVGLDGFFDHATRSRNLLRVRATAGNRSLISPKSRKNRIGSPLSCQLRYLYSALKQPSPTRTPPVTKGHRQS